MQKTLVGVVASLLLLQTSPASAQDFLGGLARRAAETAAQAVINRVVTSATATRPAATPPATTAPEPSTSAPVPAAGAEAPSGLPADFPAPRPLNYSAEIRRPDQLEFSEADKAARVAFNQIGRYSCTGCEGGHSFDSWPRHEIPGIGVGGYELENRLGALGVGEALRWTGSRTGTRYAITVTSDRAIGPWACKQLRWTGDRDGVHAERVGLICKPTDNWHELI